MKNISALILFLSLYTSLVYAAFDLRENDKCSSHIPGQEGICLEAINCEYFKTERNKLKICSFKHKAPIVCCPKSSNQKLKSPGKRISEIKCDEYKELQGAAKNRFVRATDGQFRPLFVGGTRANFNEFPHMSAIGLRRSNSGITWLCGGSLISEKFLLSAAHCVTVGLAVPNVIRIGDQDLLSAEPEISPQEFSIKRIFLHHHYEGTKKYHDLALFELSTPATFTKDVAPACLSQEEKDPLGTVEAIGYGQTSFAGPQSNALMTGYLQVVNRTECKKSYLDESELPQGITNDQICAWDPYGYRDTCQGDSGGPLQTTKYTRSFKKYYEIIGVTSFGKLCASGVPGVYSKVFPYLDWVESIVWPHREGIYER